MWKICSFNIMGWDRSRGRYEGWELGGESSLRALGYCYITLLKIVIELHSDLD